MVSPQPCDHCGKHFPGGHLFVYSDGRVFCKPCLQAMKQKHEDDPVSIHAPMKHDKVGPAFTIGKKKWK